MITLKDIETAQSKIGSAADFPQFVQDLKNMGVLKFETMVEDSHSVYHLKEGLPIASASKYSPLIIASKTDEITFVACLKIHQEGKTDYYTFCQDCAKTGIEKWVMDLEKMTCTYVDRADRNILVEVVPSV